MGGRDRRIATAAPPLSHFQRVYVHFAGDAGGMEWRLFRLLQRSERSKTGRSD